MTRMQAGLLGIVIGVAVGAIAMYFGARNAVAKDETFKTANAELVSTISVQHDSISKLATSNDSLDKLLRQARANPCSTVRIPVAKDTARSK